MTTGEAATTEEAKFDPASLKEAVYATQGGGYAIFDNDRNLFVWCGAIPSYMQEEGDRIGDAIPEMWGVCLVKEAGSLGLDFQAMRAVLDLEEEELEEN